jgi:hypothetical protein
MVKLYSVTMQQCFCFTVELCVKSMDDTTNSLEARTWVLHACEIAPDQR